MHFESAKGCTEASIVDRKLKQRWPEFNKIVPEDKFTDEDVQKAVSRARILDTSEPDGLPRDGVSTFWRLIVTMLKPSA